MKSVRVYGKVADFAGNSIEAADVIIMDSRFEPIFKTKTDAGGLYCLDVAPGVYYALMAVRMSDYAKERFERSQVLDETARLEYWAWNVPASRDVELNIRYDRLEVYALNAFRPQGAVPSYIIYFRPMGLTRIMKTGMTPVDSILKIAPRLSEKDIEVFINGQRVEVLEINDVFESAGVNKLRGYLIQASIPDRTTTDTHDRIHVVVSDPDTGEQGESTVFVKKWKDGLRKVDT